MQALNALFVFPTSMEESDQDHFLDELEAIAKASNVKFPSMKITVYQEDRAFPGTTTNSGQLYSLVSQGLRRKWIN